MDINKEVNGVPYVFQRLKTMKALALETKLLKMMGSSLGQFAMGGLDDDAGKIMAGVLDNLDENETPLFIRDVIRGCVVQPPEVGKNGTPESFEDYYADRLPEVHFAFLACLEVNFGGVIAEIKKKYQSKG